MFLLVEADRSTEEQCLVLGKVSVSVELIQELKQWKDSLKFASEICAG